MSNQSTESDRKAILLSFLANKAKFFSLLRRTWRSTFLPETIFRRSVLFNWCRPLQKKGHWKTSLMGMQMSEKWRRESVNQQIPFVYSFPGYCYCYVDYYQTPTYLAILRRTSGELQHYLLILLLLRRKEIVWWIWWMRQALFSIMSLSKITAQTGGGCSWQVRV